MRSGSHMPIEIATSRTRQDKWCVHSGTHEMVCERLQTFANLSEKFNGIQWALKLK